jgi:hypothetical protein
MEETNVDVCLFVAVVIFSSANFELVDIYSNYHVMCSSSTFNMIAHESLNSALTSTTSTIEGGKQRM